VYKYSKGQHVILGPRMLLVTRQSVVLRMSDQWVNVMVYDSGVSNPKA
jgi:hypothetical protein